MALRILWDKYETALLIEAYQQIEDGTLSRKDAVSKLSKALRQKAISSGLEIDEIFRNENGISMQLGNIQRLMHHIPGAETHNTKVFVDMVDLYFKDRSVFNAILAEAKGVEQPVKTNQESFAEWLSGHVSHRHLSDYYLAFAAIEEFAKKKTIITGSLYSVTNSSTTGKIITALNSDRIFRFLHKKQMRIITEVAQLYHKYTKENESRASVVSTAEGKSTLTEEKNEPDNTEPPIAQISVLADNQASEIREESSDKPAVELHDAITEAKPADAEGSSLLVDFSQETDYSFSKPVSGSYFGDEFYEPSWRKMFAHACKLLYDDYPDVFKDLRDNPSLGPRSVTIYDSNAVKQLISPEEIAEGFYIETKRSASDLMRALRALLDFCRVDYENLEIRYIKETTEAEPKSSQMTIDSFPETNDPALTFLEKKGLEYIDLRDKLGCLWVIGGLEIRGKLQPIMDAGVPLYFKASGGNATNGRPAWWTKSSTKNIHISNNDIAEDKAELDQPAEENPAVNPEIAAGVSPEVYEEAIQTIGGRKEFSDWLTIQGITGGSTRTALWAFSKVEEYAVRTGLITGSLYDVTDPTELDRIWDILNNSTDFISYKKQNSVTSFAFNKYRAWRSGNTRSPQGVGSKQVSQRKVAAILSNDQEEQRQAFIRWMQSKNYAIATCNGYASALASIDEYVTQHDLGEKSIYAITDQDELRALWHSLMQLSSFEAYNREQHNRFSAAARKYAEFLREGSSAETYSTASSRRSPGATAFRKMKSGVHPGRAAFEKWLEASRTPLGSIKTYADAVDHIGRYLNENGTEQRNIYSILGVSRLERLLADLRQDNEYASISGNNSSLALYALKKYIKFRSNNTSGDLDDEVAERFSAILRDDFENGFRLNSMIDRNRFKQFYSEKFCEELDRDDDEIVKILQQVGTLRDERVFYQEGSSQGDLLDDILAEVAMVFHNGATCIYYSELFGKYQEQLADQLQVYTPDVLKDLLLDSSYGEYRASKFYLFLAGRAPDADEDISRYMRKAQTPRHYESIHNVLWYIPMDTIKHFLVTKPGYVNVAQETYFYAHNLPVSADEVQFIADLIHEKLAQKSFLTDTEMRNLIEQNCPSVAINTESFTTWGLRNCLSVLLQDRFAFNGPIISEKGQALNMSQVFIEFSRSHNPLTLDELKVFAKEVNNGIIYWESVMEVMVRISADEMVPKGEIEFDIDATDAVLDELFEGEYMPIKEFKLFLHYPPISVRWNEFVLESYVAGYSKNYALLHASYTATDCCGAIVRKESGITDFSDLILDVLAHSESWQTKADALNLLVNKGYLQRKHYTKIDAILPEAKLLREKLQSQET